MDYHRGLDRNVVELLPACVDDYVSAESAVRFIDAFVEGQDLKKLGFTHAELATTGRPPFHPADLLKLYLWGYLNRVRSSRRLEAEARRNLEVMWLLRRMTPDFKTIANFRKNNLAACKRLFQEFNLLCRRLNLFGAELVAIDGSKFKAANSNKRHYTREELAELVAKVRGRIDEYFTALDQQDREVEGSGPMPTASELREKITHLQERQGRYEGLLEEMLQSGAKEVSLTDPDSRKMKGPHGGHYVGYNVQVAVDAKHHLIAAEEVVTEANDLGQLQTMAVAAKDELGVESLQAVADKGYHQAEQLEACEQAGITPLVPAQERPSGRTAAGAEIWELEKFRYEAEADAYVCPNGQTLPRRGVKESRGRHYDIYYDRSACAACPLRAQCTTSTHRVLARLPNQAVVERVAARVAAHPEVVAQRKTIVEHVFGTLRLWGHDHFLLRGLAKVRAEFSLSALAYNLRRALNVLGVGALLKALQA